ncbi:DUF7619 domain-containing protein [Xanthocytophaga agilis]|uniref:T9SS type A sorting domain-containing protein n=1 Tax=Xanthocytophaga agilis TaxID=3048010 RepID=A0AAE3R2W6_9BACT|nr:LamG-like jellyroll fold domain-containing protein [Xanthocytophaga agilis]MDJ1500350.1 T9SS type A sorting domain-containing protein [Xanthocytophaga agilis]
MEVEDIAFLVRTPFNVFVLTGTLPTVGEWIHLVVTRDQNVLKFYHQGILVGSDETKGGATYYGSGTVRAILGGRSTLTQFFNGVVDDLTIYNRALTEEEVKQLYISGLPCSYYTDKLQTTIKGRIYSDENQNCAFDNTDKPLKQVLVVTQPGNYYGITDSTGYYQISADTGTYTVSQLINATDNQFVQPLCPANNVSASVTLKNRGDSVTNVNFANKVTLLPHLESAVNSDRRRRCFTNETFVTYTNNGYAAAQGVKVYVKMPKYVIFKSADKPYTIDKDSNYVFDIGILNASETGAIHIIDSVSCVANITGLTACTKAWITPANGYTLPENSPWDSSDISLTAKCIENGRVQMIIKNVGQAAMADSTEFRVYLNAQLAFRKNYLLAKGDSLILKIPANGKTIRLEADQRTGHPRKSQTNLTIEGCVSSVSDVVSKGFVDVLPQDDAEPEVSINCLMIRDSYDPNDKQVSPAGTTNDHYTSPGSELKYTIRFQNTGTDYAYTVVLIDTLSENLDLSSLHMSAASHKYTLKVSGKEKPVLIWTFNNINLPDSTLDQAGSNGFVQFSIKPKANLPEKTLIENFADIFFDYNEPVRTNTTVNVIYDVPKVINPAIQLNESIIDRVMASEPEVLRGKISLYPNPTQNQLWIQATDATVRIEQVTVYNMLGEKQVISYTQSTTQTLEVKLGEKSRGMYLLSIQTNKGTSIQRIIVQ